MYYAKYLAMKGNEVNVITADYPKDYLNYDEGLLKEITNVPNLNIHYVSLGNLYLKIYPRMKIKGSKEKNKSRKSLKVFLNSALRKKVKKIVSIPDSYLEWRNSAYDNAKTIIEKDKPDVIFSILESPSSHLVALKLKKHFPHIKWIGFWSDPWTLSIDFSKKPFLRRYIEKKMENEIIKNVDKLLFTTSATSELYQRKFGIEDLKCDVVYRGFDLEKYELIKSKTCSTDFENIINPVKINIIHAGELYSQYRDIEPLLLALKEIKQKNYNVFEKLNIIFMGGMHGYSEHLGILAEELNIKITTRKPFDESLALMFNSDFLLLYGNKGGVQIPGKVYDYFGIDKPIISLIANTSDPLVKLLDNNPKGPVISNEKAVIIDLIKDIVNKKVNINSQFYQPNYNFQWEKIISDLEEKLNT